MHDDLDLRVIERHHDADPRYREELRQRLAAILDDTEAYSAEATQPELAVTDLVTQRLAPPERHRHRWVASAAALVSAAATVVALAVLPSNDEPVTPADQSLPTTDSSVDETVPADELPSSTPDTPELFAEIAPGAMIDLPDAPIGGRRHGGAVWTGTEMIVWGGFDDDGQRSGDGAAFNLADGTWRIIASAPIDDRSEASLMWTGTEVLVWGGFTDDDVSAHDGAAYNPATDTWRVLPPAPATMEGGIGRKSMVWTGEEAVVVGDAAAAYEPVTNRWRQLANPPVQGYPAVWAEDSIVLIDGGLLARYDLEADSWSVTSIGSQATVVVIPGADGRIIALPSAMGEAAQLLDAHGNPIAELPAFPGDPGLFGDEVGASGWWVGDEAVFWIWTGEFPYGSEQMWSLNPTTRTWRQLDDARMIEPAVVVAGEVLLAWGGSGPGGAPPDQIGGVAYRAGTPPAGR